MIDVDVDVDVPEVIGSGCTCVVCDVRCEVCNIWNEGVSVRGRT